VGDEQRGAAVKAVADIGLEFSLRLRIDSRKRLIQHHKVGVTGESSDDLYPSALAPGEGSHGSVERFVWQSRPSTIVLDIGFCGVIEDEANVANGCEVLAQTVLLEHSGASPPSEPNYLPGIGGIDSQNEAGDRRFSRAIRAHDRGDATLVKLE
jgi:hypothetical protein